jgi:integrase/recombinase XerC
MNPTQRLYRKSTDWFLKDQLAPYVDTFTPYLSERRYASHTIETYLGCVAHFGHWMSQCRLDIHRIDEAVLWRFRDDHLPQCDWAIPVHRTHRDLRAALKYLLVVLRAEAVIAERTLVTTPADEELRRFDDHMNHVRGLAPRKGMYFGLIPKMPQARLHLLIRRFTEMLTQ